MEHKLDDFFRKKIDAVEDSLPDNSAFDEQLFWDSLQKNLDKPQRKGWWKWLAAVACLGGLVLWIISVSPIKPETPVASDTKTIELPKGKPNFVAVTTPEKAKVKVHKPKKKVIAEPKKEFKIEIEQLAIKVNNSPALTPIIRQDSIHFKPLIVAEAKPQFKTIHVNEISNTEKAPIPQPKFKIRFAARNQQ
jgi:hypothetical protein